VWQAEDDPFRRHKDISMTRTAQSFLVLALAPLLLAGALRPSNEAGTSAALAGGGDAKLELASLKAEARMQALHIDGP
jgi:hypothetical protein